MALKQQRHFNDRMLDIRMSRQREISFPAKKIKQHKMDDGSVASAGTSPRQEIEEDWTEDPDDAGNTEPEGSAAPRVLYDLIDLSPKDRWTYEEEQVRLFLEAPQWW
jgi:hypothetical protein